ncbi:MAG TPA: MarR family winged helix-turn-helix transcriptional regulator, partial [Burkholderiaceae bacterium]
LPTLPDGDPSAPGAQGGAPCATSPTPPPVRDGYYRGENYRLEEGIGFLMKHAMESVTRQIDAQMAAYCLTNAQWRPLVLLSHGTCTTAAEMARKTNCDTGAMTRMLDRLEDKGLVRRNRGTDDRRVQHLELTAEGEQLAAIVPYVIADVLNTHLSGMTRAEVDVLKDLLKRMIAAGQREAARTSNPAG